MGAVLDGVQNCSSTEQEKEQSKAHTTDEFRLACQTIDGDVTVRRLVLNSEDIESHSERSKDLKKKIAILFSDIRGFTFSKKQHYMMLFLF